MVASIQSAAGVPLGEIYKGGKDAKIEFTHPMFIQTPRQSVNSQIRLTYTRGSRHERCRSSIQ